MPDTEPLPIPEPPDNSRIEFTHNMRVYAAWSSSEAAVANGYEPEERWRLYDHMAAWVTWSELVEAFGESLRSLVLLKPYSPPEPLELSAVERVALMTDFHFSTCDDRGRCPDCTHKVKEYRAVLAAVTPVMAEAERRRQAAYLYAVVQSSEESEDGGPSNVIEFGYDSGIIHAALWLLANTAEACDWPADVPEFEEEIRSRCPAGVSVTDAAAEWLAAVGEPEAVTQQ